MLPSWIRSRNDIPRPMYFLAIETTSRRLAEVSCSRASRPMTTMSPLRSRSLVLVRHLGVVAHPLEQVGIVAGLDPALERRERHALARPVPDRPQPDVVARVEVAVVDGEERPVEERDQGVRRRPLVVGVEELLRLLEALLRPVRLGVAPGLDEVEVRRRDQQVLGGLGGDGCPHHLVRLGPVGQPVLRLLWCASCAPCRGGSTRGARRCPSTAPRPAAPRARWPWPGRPPPRRSAARPCRSP